MASVEEIGRTFNLCTAQVLQRKLEDFENITKELFDCIDKAYTQKGAKNNYTTLIQSLVDQLIEKDEMIKSSLSVAMKQLEKQKQIQHVKDEIARKDQEIFQLHTQLKEAEHVLATAIYQAKKKLEATEQAKEASVSCEELIKFAFRISSGNSVEAPPDWLPGDPRRPYPLDIEMRCGALGLLSQKGPHHGQLVAMEASNTDARVSIESEDFEHRKSIEESLPSVDSSSRNGGIWPGPVAEDTAHLATMPVSAMMSHPTNGKTSTEDVEFMSSSSDSSSSGDSS